MLSVERLVQLLLDWIEVLNVFGTLQMKQKVNNVFHCPPHCPLNIITIV